MKSRRGSYLGPYSRPPTAAWRALEGHPNADKIRRIISSDPDPYDPILDNPRNIPLDAQSGFWEREEDDYSEESYP